MQMLINNKIVIWLVLAIPLIVALVHYGQQNIDIMDFTALSGEWAARWMIFAMMIGPAMFVFGNRPLTRWLLARRRYFGVAAFVYAVVHLVAYIVDMAELAAILDEIALPGIWTGWAALLILIPIALTSNDIFMRILGGGWKRLQRFVYAAAALTLLHWIWVHNDMAEAIIHFVPLLILYASRIANFKLVTT